MQDFVGAPRSKPEWAWDNPLAAAREFTAAHPEFAMVEPESPFNEGQITRRVNYGLEAFQRRVR